MSYEIRRENNKYSVVNSTTGYECGNRLSLEAARQLRTELNNKVKDFEAYYVPGESLETELDKLETVMLEHGPALVGVAMTNTPHLRFRDEEITITEEDGNKLLRIPILRTGIFKHKGGKLRFTPKVLHEIVKNHNQGITDFAPSLNLHHQRGKALAWFHQERGGRLVVEGNLLVGYGKPTTDEALSYVEDGLYAYASAEFTPDYSSNVEQITMESLEEISPKEIEMELNYTEKDGTFVFDQEQMNQVEQMIADLEAAQAQVVALEEAAGKTKTDIEGTTVQVAQLEKDLNDANAKIKELDAPDTTELEMPEAVKIQLEEQAVEITRLKEAGLKTKLNAIISNASAPVDGKTHPAFLLEFAKKALYGEPIGNDDKVVKLESSDAGGYARYLQNGVIYLLENLPRTVQEDSNLETDDQRPLDSEDNGAEFQLQGDYTEEDMEQAAAHLWGLVE